jgi:flagellar hook-basal body complex protein FliE
MTIAPIGPITGITPALAPTGAASATSATAGTGFADQLGRGLANLQAAQNQADGLAIQAATGQLTDVHDYLIAATQAGLATKLTVAVRNKGLEAFNEIMRMQA